MPPVFRSRGRDPLGRHAAGGHFLGSDVVVDWKRLSHGLVPLPPFLRRLRRVRGPFPQSLYDFVQLRASCHGHPRWISSCVAWAGSPEAALLLGYRRRRHTPRDYPAPYISVRRYAPDQGPESWSSTNGATASFTLEPKLLTAAATSAGMLTLGNMMRKNASPLPRTPPKPSADFTPNAATKCLLSRNVGAAQGLGHVERVQRLCRQLLHPSRVGLSQQFEVYAELFEQPVEHWYSRHHAGVDYGHGLPAPGQSFQVSHAGQQRPGRAARSREGDWIPAPSKP